MNNNIWKRSTTLYRRFQPFLLKKQSVFFTFVRNLGLGWPFRCNKRRANCAQHFLSLFVSNDMRLSCMTAINFTKFALNSVWLWPWIDVNNETSLSESCSAHPKTSLSRFLAHLRLFILEIWKLAERLIFQKT